MSQCTIRVAFANRTELQSWQNATAVSSRINSSASVDVSAAKLIKTLHPQPCPHSTAAPQAEAVTHSHRMKRVAGRIMAINRFMPPQSPGKAASTSPGSVSADENDLSLDLGDYAGRATRAAQASPPSAAAAAEFSTVGCSDDIELSVMAPPVDVPSSKSASLNAAAADLDDGVPSRNSVSSSLAPRLQQYRDDSSQADVRCPPLLPVIEHK